MAKIEWKHVTSEQLYTKAGDMITKLNVALGLDITTEESIRMIRDVYMQVEQANPDRYSGEGDGTIMLFSMESALGKLYKKYSLARKKYINHALYALQSRSVSAKIDEIMPPYVTFPEQSSKAEHGEYNKAYVYYLSTLDDKEILDHFAMYPLPKYHGIDFIKKADPKQYDRIKDMVIARVE